MDSEGIVNGTAETNELPWQQEGLLYNTFGRALRRRFGGRVQRVSVDAGFTCPNVDGALTRGGCNFCDNRSFSPSRRVRLKRVSEQLASGIQSVRRRYRTVSGFIAYFQPATNTYAPVDQLEEIYQLAFNQDPAIVGLAIGTRPDCMPESVIELAAKLAQQHYVSVEFGMQTMHQPGLDWMNRAHSHDDLINSIDRSRDRGFETCVHIILGIPGETHQHMMQTALEVAKLGPDAIKLHNLYAVQDTPLGQEVLDGTVHMMERQDYINTVVDFLERIAPETIVERISGDAPPQYLIEPKWCLEKSALKLQIEAEFRRRGTRQGSLYQPPDVLPSDRPRPVDKTPEAVKAQIDVRGRLPVLKMER
ncbi:Oxygen-independent coproporphyrinogen-III oxidase 1 [Stieleria bergensis]|uniref:Oxygen-independent coproporphyrinogen-III oxidase 1 n=1 Tax=Stieleria bergensis TaxID=2528025 RepID=A0A517SPE5_9BACT|nr:MAG: TIGR01212 family radical SAM protein [Rhodopirellula sp. TMED11]QDT57992.1 Oxygen-independent coproporphyrinogen-III oxidase 1 [Planctomycetes bacterium SV_7m_r]